MVYSQHTPSGCLLQNLYSGTVRPSEEARWSAAVDSRMRDGEGCPPRPQTRNVLLCLTCLHANARPRDRESSWACSRIQPRSGSFDDKVL